MNARARYDEITDDLIAQQGDIERATMMGMPSLKRNGKLLIGFWRDAMVFKLTDPGARERALALDGATLFDPSERGRPMKEWVQVPVVHTDRWPDLARDAFDSA